MAIALERSDMKKFNNDFTTPEQSMRLLELGLQPNSANLYYSKFERETFGLPKLCYDKRYCDIVPYGYEEYYLPCWSVGRLMEIWKICRRIPWDYMTKRPLIDELVDDFELFYLDFSELEE